MPVAAFILRVNGRLPQHTNFRQTILYLSAEIKTFYHL